MLGVRHCKQKYAAKMLKLSFMIIVCCSISTLASKRRPLNSFIRHHERLDYNLQEFHSRVRRSTISSPFGISDLVIKAFGKELHLRLRRDHTIFSPEYKITDGRGQPIKFDPGNFVEGDVKGYFGSYVHGAVKRGRFQGKYLARPQIGHP